MHRVGYLLLVLFVLIGADRLETRTIYTAQRTITTTVSKVNINDNSQLLLVNQSATISVYVGAAAVTTSTGVEIKPGATLSLMLATGESLYGITASSTARLDTLENQR